MSETASPTLLPEGLRDILPPDAAAVAALVERLMASFEANGYDRVSPPLVEFESTLLSGMGAATADRIFRMVDPISQRTLGLRADVTAQIARLASTRLQTAPRPLRLMYEGQVLRVKGRQLRPERQFTQVGFELIGPDSAAADAEAIIIAAEGVAALGIERITVDLAMPPLVPAVLSAEPFDESHIDALLIALNHKDVAGIRSLGGSLADTLTALVEATGPVASARERLAKVKLPKDAALHLETLFAVSDQVKSEASALSLTLDLVENRGLQYHTGVTFFLFAKGSSQEIGRGGRYRIDHDEGRTEPATGVTLFMDGLLPVAPTPVQTPCVFVPYGTGRETVAKLQAEGNRVRVSLEDSDDPISEAKQLGCSHVLLDGAVKEVSEEGKAS